MAVAPERTGRTVSCGLLIDCVHTCAVIDSRTGWVWFGGYTCRNVAGAGWQLDDGYSPASWKSMSAWAEPPTASWTVSIGWLSRTAAGPTWRPDALRNATPGNPVSVHAVLPRLVNTIGVYWLPAAVSVWPSVTVS